MERDKSSLDPLLILLLVGLVFWLYWPATTIPFLYSERDGIPLNRVVNDVERFYQDMVTPLGFFQRPLSVFSYTLNYYFVGDDTAAYHYTNIAIHAVNVLLVYFLAKTFSCSAFLAALIFASHPLATSVAGQIFGRNYSLALMFVLAGYLLYRQRTVRGEQLGIRACATISFLFLLGVLSKQTMVIAPLLLLWDWMHRTGGSVSELLSSAEKEPQRAILILIVLGFGIGFVLLYAVPLSLTAPVGPLTYFLSQLGNVHHLMSFLLTPYQTALLHDLFFYRTPWHAEVFVGAFLLFACLTTTMRYRRYEFAFFLGAIVLFLIPSNSFLAKNEILREWRIYPSLVFLCLLLGSLPAHLRAQRGKGGVFLAATASILLCAWTIFNVDSVRSQLHLYQTRASTWQQVATRYPYSADAYNNWGKALGELGRNDEALLLFQRAVSLGPDVSIYLKNLSTAQQSTGAFAEAQATDEQFEKIRRLHGEKALAIFFKEDLGELISRNAEK